MCSSSVRLTSNVRDFFIRKNVIDLRNGKSFILEATACCCDDGRNFAVFLEIVSHRLGIERNSAVPPKVVPDCCDSEQDSDIRVKIVPHYYRNGQNSTVLL